ncbi:MAG: MBL fold metallo-hydrolase, partial [Actinomycetota bacterium]|nr:MBL fold metallo-hydrolase [Actinomycetota bacterium]
TRLGRFNPERARELGVPEGPLWGQLHRGRPVTLDDGRVVEPSTLVGPTRTGRRIAITGDTRPCAGTVEAARGADVLVHEATFADEERERAGETLHSTALDAAEVARAADVGLLALTHLSNRYYGGEIEREAQTVFANTVVPRDLDIIVVPYHERGSPELVRGGAKPP